MSENKCCEDEGCSCAEEVVNEVIDESISLTGGIQRVTSRVNKDDGSKLNRNDQCPCKSGKKFKRCCWELLNQ